MEYRGNFVIWLFSILSSFKFISFVKKLVDNFEMPLSFKLEREKQNARMI